MSFSLQYRQALDLLADMHGVVPSRRKSLMFRVQHFKKLDFPSGLRTGRGAPARYEMRHLMELMLGFELLQLGMPPERIVRIIDRTGAMIALAGRFGILGCPIPGSDEFDDLIAVVEAQALIDFTRDYGKEATTPHRLYFTARSGVQDTVEHAELDRRRVALVNVSAMLQSAAASLSRAGTIQAPEFDLELRNWSARAMEENDGDG